MGAVGLLAGADLHLAARVEERWLEIRFGEEYRSQPGRGASFPPTIGREKLPCASKTCRPIYDRAAGYYDALTDVVFGRLLGLEEYREHAVDLLGDLAGARVLDVGCGTGRNFPILAPRVTGAGYIVGLDYSRGMLDRARHRIEDHEWNHIGLVRGDAARLAGLRRGFDAVVSVWCLGIVHDLPSALQAALDVLRPGELDRVVDAMGGLVGRYDWLRKALHEQGGA